MFLSAVEETLCCGAKAMTASFYDPMKAIDTVQIDLDRHFRNLLLLLLLLLLYFYYCCYGSTALCWALAAFPVS
jgi:hypothetical protein